MGMKGFITGSLVTLGVVGLVAALKESDYDGFDVEDCKEMLDFGSFANDEKEAEKAVSEMTEEERSKKVLALQTEIARIGKQIEELSKVSESGKDGEGA